MAAHDLIVCFDEKKMGFGDILFAAKVAGELKKSLIAQNKLVGEVYLVCDEDKRGITKLEHSKADCEFGVNFVLFKDMQTLIDQRKVKPAVIIDGPAPMLIKLKVPQATVVVSLEYTYGPFRAVNLGNSFARAGSSKQESYVNELIKYEKGLLAPYPNSDKSIIRTGLLDALDEQGIITTEVLIRVGSLLHAENFEDKSEAKREVTGFRQGLANKLTGNPPEK